MSRHHPIPGWFIPITGLLTALLWSSPASSAATTVPADPAFPETPTPDGSTPTAPTASPRFPTTTFELTDFFPTSAPTRHLGWARLPRITWGGTRFVNDANMTSVGNGGTRLVDPEASAYGPTSGVGIGDEPTPGFRLLLRTWPNPTRGKSHVRFTLATGGEVSLEVYDLSGRRVRTLLHEFLDPGIHTTTWDGRTETGQSAPAGMYFFRLLQNHTSSTRKLLRVH